MPSTITLAQLRGACKEQKDLFKRTFGEQVHLTLALAEKHAGDFNFDWAAQHLLPAPLWAEYERQQAPLLAEYERQKAPLWAEYERQEACLFTTLYLSAP